MDVDVVVIGAGAAGLAATARLEEGGVNVLTVEARDRIGGRVWTVSQKYVPAAVELGAEFLHGEAGEVEELARAAALRIVDIAEHRWVSDAKGLRRVHDFLKRLQRVMKRLSVERKPDRSFAAALERMRSLPSADRRLARQYVEGFHAADTTLISERSLAEDVAGDDEPDEHRLRRLLEGYGSALEALARPVADRVHLGVTVTRVRWARGRVEITADFGDRPRTIAARRAVITAPLGVLKAAAGERGCITFDPEVPQRTRNAIDHLEMGFVLHVVLHFRRSFWAERAFIARRHADGLERASFFHALRDVPFPVWWTPYPLGLPMLTCWRGGPAVPAMSRWTREALGDAAVRSLAVVLHVSARKIREELVGMQWHDWTNDPFSRGGYSYTRVGGSGAAAALARPVEETLFFAGEHADSEGRNGTVHGAIGSGRQAAERVLRSLSR